MSNRELVDLPEPTAAQNSGIPLKEGVKIESIRENSAKKSQIVQPMKKPVESRRVGTSVIRLKPEDREKRSRSPISGRENGPLRAKSISPVGTDPKIRNGRSTLPTDRLLSGKIPPLIGVGQTGQPTRGSVTAVQNALKQLPKPGDPAPKKQVPKVPLPVPYRPRQQRPVHPRSHGKSLVVAELRPGTSASELQMVADQQVC